MSERKAVIKNADMSEVRGGRVSTRYRAFSVALRHDGNGMTSAGDVSSPFAATSSATVVSATVLEGRTSTDPIEDARLTEHPSRNPQRCSRESQDLQQDAVDCATQVRLLRRLASVGFWKLPTRTRAFF